MRTNDPSNITPIVPQRTMATPPSADSSSRLSTNEAAANIVRGQIAQIFDGSSTENSELELAPQSSVPIQPVELQPAPSLAPEPTLSSPVATQAKQDDPTTNLDSADPIKDHWKKYHSEWQNYYQQYYQRYYIGQVNEAKKTIVQTTPQTHIQTVLQNQPSSVSQDEALDEIRSDLRGKITQKAKKVRRSRHFMPAIAALSVMGIFLLLQYNSMLFSYVNAYMSPGNINPANVIVSTDPNVNVGPEPKLIIPKINVDVPIVFDVTPDHDSQMRAMHDGVAWFGIPGANSKPGQIGNTVLSGHSSNDILETGNYKFIFARLEQLSQGDTFYVNYESKRYTYTITKMEVVKPTEVSKLIYPTDKPIVTLITCTPLGTSLNRLLVTAEQISPAPSQATAAPDPAGAAGSEAEIPGQTPTFLSRIFG